MDATVFKEQLKSIFNIHLSPKELSALIAYFDQDGDCRVDGAEFLSVFFREGKKEKAKIRRRHKLQEARIAEQMEEQRLRQIDKFARQVEAKVIWPSAESLKPPKINTTASPKSVGAGAAESCDGAGCAAGAPMLRSPRRCAPK